MPFDFADPSHMTETGRSRGALLAIVALASFLAFLALYLSFATIPDSDSYFHLALARLTAQEGFVRGLDWTRFSVFAKTLGDKEALFHVLLIPFTTLMPGEVGGRIALAILCAAIATLLARAGLDTLGRGGLLLPLVAFVGSPFFYARAFRLRPELLGLILIIVALELLARRRHLALALVSAAFALTYVVSHLLTALAVIVSAWWWIRGRDRDWRAPVASILGTASGILMHPNFPDNLVIWRIVNITYFRMKGQLDVGNEIGPPSLQGAILLNAGVWLALVALAFGTRSGGDPEPDERRFRTAEAYAIGALFFIALFTRMERMITYVVPLTLLAATYLLRARGRDLTAIRLGSIRVPVAVALAACSLAGLPRFLDFTSRVMSNPAAEREWRDVGAMLPAGARVAAHWGPTGFLVFFAPQARYLNVLEPLLMYEVAPDVWRTQQRMFAGWEPDLPLVASSTLDSEFVFAPLDHVESGAGAARRFAADPRLVAIRSGGLALARLVPGSNRPFVLDWTGEGGRPYPRLTGPAGGIEGFVDASRLGDPGRCTTLERRFDVGPDGGSLRVDFAPFGPAELTLDGERLVRSEGVRAFLAAATRVDRSVAPGSHTLRVRTCPDSVARINGFYLVDRSGAPR